jgi:RNA polymerase sigma-54 factor
MRFEQHQSARADQCTNQHLMLLPAMQQALTILQAPLLELGPILREALEDNPVWEIEEPVWEPVGTGLSGAGYCEELTEDARPLKGQLAEEIQLSFQEPDRGRALRLLQELTSDGLLEESCEGYAVILRCSEKEVAALVDRCQQLDPPGIFAFSPQEALLLQMERLGRRNTLGYTILKDHYEPLIHLRLKELCRTLAVTEEDLLATLKCDLRGLRRGKLFEDPTNFNLLIDASITFENGQARIDIHDETVPRLYMQPSYLGHLEDPSCEPVVADFLEKGFREGLFLKKALHQRGRTLRRILEKVVPVQQAFLNNSECAAQELTMQQIAQELGLSESTLSRAVSNKWLGTPRGLVPMRALFRSPGTVQGEFVGQDVYSAIRKIVAKEQPESPLSDEHISKQLRAQGFDIARRTVAKYRNLLGIPPQKERRWRIP